MAIQGLTEDPRKPSQSAINFASQAMMDEQPNTQRVSNSEISPLTVDEGNYSEAVGVYTPRADGGDGLSGVGTSIGGAVGGAEGEAIGGSIGAAGDMMISMWVASEKRAEERKDQLALDMRNNRKELQVKQRQRMLDKQNLEDRERSKEFSDINLENAKTQQAEARADKFRKIAQYYSHKVYGSPLNRGLTNA